jgi:hypothetical protein
MAISWSCQGPVRGWSGVEGTSSATPFQSVTPTSPTFTKPAEVIRAAAVPRRSAPRGPHYIFIPMHSKVRHVQAYKRSITHPSGTAFHPRVSNTLPLHKSRQYSARSAHHHPANQQRAPTAAKSPAPDSSCLGAIIKCDRMGDRLAFDLGLDWFVSS